MRLISDLSISFVYGILTFNFLALTMPDFKLTIWIEKQFVTIASSLIVSLYAYKLISK